MKRIRDVALVLTIAFVVASCTTESAATTLVVELTTSTDSPTTISDLPTTASTDVTTTTSTPPEGEALIVSDGVVLGWWGDGGWHRRADHRPLTGHLDFTVLPFGEDSLNVTAGEPSPYCDWVVDDSWWFDLGLSVQPFSRIAVSAPWDVMEAAFEETRADKSLIDAASEYLSGVGIEVESPVFSQLIEVDLEGDETPEVIAVLDNQAGISGVSEEAYGFAMVKFDDDEVQILGGFRASGGPDSDGFPYSVYQYRLVALVDANRDGLVEVGLDVSGDEGGGTTLYEMNLSETTLVPVLSAGCGS